MTSEEVPGTRNTALPWPPRVYDFLTGGGNSFAPDAEFGRRIAKKVPWVQVSMWINKRHRTKAALVLAHELGITQFIDLGCGYPSRWGARGGTETKKGCEYIPPHTFDIVHNVHKADARVVYVDVDDYVRAHAGTELDEHEGTIAAKADARDVPALLTLYEVIELLDLDQPVGVILHDVLPWLTDDEAALVLRCLHELLPAGSAVSLTHATVDDDPAAMAVLVSEYAKEGFNYRPRSLAAVEDLLGAWGLLSPGLQPTGRWREEQPPHIPQHLRTTWKLPAEESHAYAAVTVPKTARPEPTTVTGMLAKEPDRTPGLLLVGATLKALREQRDVSLSSAAASMSVPPLALALWESGSHRLTRKTSQMLRAMELDDYGAQSLLERLLPPVDGMWSSHLPWEREEFSDLYPGNLDRANAALRAATGVRAFALDRIPEAFQTSEYAALFSRDHLIGPVARLLPEIDAPPPQDTEACTWDLVLDEILLERAFGHPQVLAGQLDHLLFIDALPHITVRVLRLDTPFAMPVASLTEHTLTGGTLWRVDGFTYRGLSRGTSCRLLLDRARENAVPEATSRSLLEQARDRALGTPASPTATPQVHPGESSDA
ncbi:Scr1 family TA system antitoxin-like transcriptional regulator [Streptomyces sp. NBC_01433]|uniref:Scr1 family TA system antitoxin-like transcriptional regulator n=1 Tax=Streptomyces sp. NBC_01433 TaxID=2903864 RepID=UPI00224EF4FA|nr:Scr1 family TA system antitoxin-like transcriptional regulator [Streptomyces sp. NBC_01433]MCX4681490.1 Scr1 family TA system antitoxin-like transcriptional regulator [Streptomyces sp. NBC_01433]